MRTHHHPWRPHMDRESLMNPFAPITQRSPIFDRVELAETEEEEDEGPLDPALEQTDDRSPEKA
jgi:hypothetical protein